MTEQRAQCWSWLVIVSALVAVGCSTESPADSADGNLRRQNPNTELAAVASSTALEQEESGDRAAAIESYSQVIEEAPHTVDAYFARGQLYHANGQYEEAEADFNSVLRHEPRRAAGYFNRGRTQQAQGNHHQALVSYSLAISVEPRQAKWYYLRGKAYEALADETEADGDEGRAREMRRRAEQNFAAAQELDPRTDFGEIDN